MVKRNGNCIQAVSVGGTVTTFVKIGAAGYQDRQDMVTWFHIPCQVVHTAVGNLCVVNSANNRIRKTTSSRLVTTFVWMCTEDNKDGHTQATFDTSSDVAVSPNTANVIVNHGNL